MLRIFSSAFSTSISLLWWNLYLELLPIFWLACCCCCLYWAAWIKATMRYHLTLVRMAIIKDSTNNKCCRGCREKGTLLQCWWECKLVQSLWRTISVSHFSCSVVSDSLQPHGLQHARLPRPSPSSRACSNSCPLSWWCHPTISSSVVPFSSCLQFFPSIEKPFLCISSQLCGWWHYVGSLKLAIVGVFTPLHAYVFIVTQLCPALWPNGL